MNEAGEAWCWGFDEGGQLGGVTTETCGRWPCATTPIRVETELTFSDITAGLSHTCGLTAAGDAYCWGKNGNGQLGDGSTGDRTRPVLVSGGLAWREIRAGFRHTCAIAVDGSAYCWGLNDKGQGGNGTTDESVSPTKLQGDMTWLGLSKILSEWHTCGTSSDGFAYCWGFGLDGQLGNGFEQIPTPSIVLTAVKLSELTVGVEHSCGLSPDGQAYCWGRERSPLAFQGSVPAAVSGGPSFVSLTSGYYGHACGLTANGIVYCWGRNYDGESGLGDDVDFASEPTVVLGQVRPTSVPSH